MAADVLEPNDSFASPTNIGTGDQTITELTIHQANNDDWYKWTASANGQLTVTLQFETSAGDLDLEVYDANQAQLAESISTTDDEQASLAVVADQMYFFRVLGFRGDVQPDYSLSVNGPDLLADALETNDSAPTAHHFRSGDQTHDNLNIHRPGNDDWYSWTASASGPLTVDVLFAHALGDLNVELRNSNGTFISSSASLTDNERISSAVVAGQTYLIRVFGNNGMIQRNYSISINGPEPVADTLEPNDQLKQAVDLIAGDQIRTGLTIHTAGNDDWYKWTAATDGILELNVRFNDELGDVDVELYNVAEKLVAISKSTNDNEQLMANVMGGQMYFVRVFGVDGALLNNYSLEIDGPDPLPDVFEPNDTFATPFDLASNDQMHDGLTIHQPGNDDWYKWTASTNGTLLVDVQFQHVFGNLDVEVYDAAQVLVASSISVTDNESVSFPVTAGQKYVIRVFGVNSSLQQKYRLTLDGPEIVPDRLEPNNSISQPTILGAGDQTHAGLNVHKVGNEDWYQWAPTISGPLTVQLVFLTALGDLDLELYDSLGALVASATSVTDNETVTADVNKGELYFIHVIAFPGFVQPDYDLIIDGPEIQPDAFEDNDRREVASELGAGDQMHQNLTIHEIGNEDWFQWTPVENGQAIFELLFDHSEGNINLELYDANSRLIADSTSSTDNEQVITAVAAGQSFFIRVLPVGLSLQRNYTLAINGPGPDRDALESNDTLASASDLGRGRNIHKGLTIHAPGNDDWYKWTAMSTESVEFAVLFQHDLGDINLQVFDAAEQLIGSSASSSNDEEVTVRATADQMYFTRVFGANGATQRRYDLVISPEGPTSDSAEPNDTQDSAFDVGTGDQVLGGLTIHAANNEDWFKWQATNGGTLGLEILFSHALGNLTLELLDSSLSVVARASSSTDNESISASVVASQMYFVRVIGVGGALQERYDLIFQANDSPTISSVTDLAILEDTSQSLPLTIGDDETDADMLGVSIVSSNTQLLTPAGIVLDRNGPNLTLTVTPTANQLGSTTITVSVTDSEGASTAEEFVLTVVQANDPPTVADPLGAITVSEDSANTIIPLAQVFADIDVGDTLTFSVESVDQESLLSATIVGNTLTIDYLPNQTGEASVVVRATDVAGSFAEDTLRVTVSAINDAPIIQLPLSQSVDEDASLEFSAASENQITIDDVDAQQSSLMVVYRVGSGRLQLGSSEGVTVTGNGTPAITLNGPLVAINRAVNGLVYSPEADFNGADTLMIEANDLGATGQGGPKMSTGELPINVNAVNDLPVIATTGSFQVAENDVDVVTVDASDRDGDALQFSIAGGADGAQFDIDMNTGQLRFVVPPDFENPNDVDRDNTYQVTVSVRDGQAAVARQISVMVTDVDEAAPTAEFDKVTPNPRAGAVDQVQLVFSESVSGLDVGDLRLTRSANDATMLDLSDASLEASDNRTWTLRNIRPLTGATGQYNLTLVAANSDIVDAAGQPLAADAAVTWTNGAGDANLDGQFNQFDIIAVLQGGKYLSPDDGADWTQGDWNLDGIFNQFDIVLAQQTHPGHYLLGPFAARKPSESTASVDHVLADDNQWRSVIDGRWS